MLRRRISIKFLPSMLMLLIFSCLFVLFLSRALNRDLNHDEHQFVAAGLLLADNLLLPYIDYPYQHLPNLVFFYALIFKFTNFNLLSARLFSIICSVVSLGVMFHLARSLFRVYNDLLSNLVAFVSIIFFMTNPLFDGTSGLAWNHDFPLMLTLLSFLSLYHGSRKALSKKRCFISGMFLGLAMGTRLSYATAVIPFSIYLFLSPDRKINRAKLVNILIFGLGLFFALLPSLGLFALDPKNFIFGNIVYPQLNPVYRRLLRHRVAMNLSEKAIYFVSEVLRSVSNGVAFWGFLAVAMGVAIQSLRSKKRIENEVVFIFLTVFFILFGAFAPTPSWFQYFYASIPFMLLAILFGVASLKLPQQYIALTLVILALCSFLGGKDIIYGYWSDLKFIREPNKLVTMKAHHLGVEMRSILDGGKILTLSPIFPLEGGFEIYEAFATGPFTWRTAPLLSAEKRQEYGVISFFELERLLNRDPPNAILIGFEASSDGFEFGDVGGLEKPLRSYAINNGFKPVQITTDLVQQEVELWIR